MSLWSYLPQDRRRALSAGVDLPDQTQGAALLADISGFTQLTEQLTQTHGARRGAEALSQRLNAVYGALISALEAHGGSVLTFAGDAITCWFEAPAAAPRAVAAAGHLQTTMRAFPELSLKVAVTTGPARRWVVGDAAIQRLDVLAGATLARLATAEHLAQRGEVLVDEATAAGAGLRPEVWRTDPDTAGRFGVVAAAALGETSLPAAAPAESGALEADWRAWVLPAVYAREQGGLGEFLTELRPVTALFMRFGGIDYDADETAQAKLHALVAGAQQVLAQQAGALLQLIIGDKGSYLYAGFGAPTAHEDDPRRAAQAALALRELPQRLPFLPPVQIGVSAGVMRVGAYGGPTRRTYGALGDEVNTAARLMQAAGPGEVLVSAALLPALADSFVVEVRPPLALKGKAEPLAVGALQAARRRALRLHEPRYHLPLIGRRAELAQIEAGLRRALAGQGQVIGVQAEAGLGKSRLIAEAARTAAGLGLAVYGGAGESSGTRTAYLAWQAIAQALFTVDPAEPQAAAHLAAALAVRAPHRTAAGPVLAPVLDLPLAENDFTRPLPPQDRRNLLAAVLEDCLAAAARERPLVVILEDAHWLDPLSQELLLNLARASAAWPICWLVVYRPLETADHGLARLTDLPHFTALAFAELAPAETSALIQAKLAQLFPGRPTEAPAAVVSALAQRAQGNPFFVEEVLNYLRDRQLDPYTLTDPAELELPASLHALILSRIDQLTEPQKAMMKVASVIGRLFPFSWLAGYYPALGLPETLKDDLEVLMRLEMTPLDTPAPELAYLFKHIVTQEVAYESLPYASRAQLHEQLAQYLEGLEPEQHLYRLAFHYGRSGNRAKQREYFRRAGERAEAAYANATARDYYLQLEPLLDDAAERQEILRRLGGILEVLGDWPAAEARYRAALALADQHADSAGQALSQTALGGLCRARGDLAGALEWLSQAQAQWQALPATAETAHGLGRTLTLIGLTHFSRADYSGAQPWLEQALPLTRQAGDRAGEARTLHGLGLVAGYQSQHAVAQPLYEEALALRRAIGDKRGEADTLAILGFAYLYTGGDPRMARGLFEQSLALRQLLGDKAGQASSLNDLANAAADQGDFAGAQAQYTEALALFRALGDQRGTAIVLENLGEMAYQQGAYAQAQAWHTESLTLMRRVGNQLGIADELMNLGLCALAANDPAAAGVYFRESLPLAAEIKQKWTISYNLTGLAAAAWQAGQPERAARLLGAAEAVLSATGSKMSQHIQPVFDRTAAAVRGALAAAEEALAEGGAWPLETAVAYAVTEPA